MLGFKRLSVLSCKSNLSYPGGVVVVLLVLQNHVLCYCYVGEKEYYERQFATLKSFEEVDSVVDSQGLDEEDLEEQAQQERAMKISNYANVVLLAFKVTSKYSTGFSFIYNRTP